MTKTPVHRLLVAIAALLVLALAGPIRAQDAEAINGEVAIEVQYFGVGNAVRAGDWAGIRLALTDLADRVRDVAIRLHIVDPDGDTSLYQREVTLTPATPLGAWLYAPIPWSFSTGDSLTVTVREVDRSGEDPVVGRQIGYERIAPALVVSAEQAMIGIVGRETFGLLQYEERGRVPAEESITSHERTRVVQGISPDLRGLPSEWLGLAPFETLVWTDGDPGTIPEASMVQAVREWVHRGGHLVVVMESVGDGWFAPTSPFRDILPDATPNRLTGVDYEPFRGLLARPGAGSDSIDLPDNAVLNTFSLNGDAPPGEAIEVATGPRGVVIVRRVIGAGMVTVIGLDLSAGDMAGRGLIRADAFWNRVLGKRADVLTGERLDALASSGVANAIRTLGNLPADRFIRDEINLTGTVSVGVLFGLGLFSVYWLVSGFGSFALLKSRGLERHAWVVFLLVIALFTGIAWAGARVLKPTDVRTLHVTFLDHVYGQSVDRARSFLSVMLPEYGSQRVTVVPQADDEPWRQALSPWADPDDAGTSRSFPDARPYVISTRRPDGMSVPARQTVKQFRADWLGAPVWTMPVPLGEGNEPRVGSDDAIAGVLTHGLPVALEDVVVFHVRGQRSVGEVRAAWAVDETGVLMFDTLAVKLPEPWEPGEPLDLGAVFASAGGAGAEGDAYLDRIVPRSRPGQMLVSNRGDDWDANLVHYHDLLAQPEYKEQDVTRSRRAFIRRRMTHTLGMGRWFTSPCVVITGQLNGAPTPVPIALDGEPVDSEGRTFFRWVYPLQGEPLRVR